MTRRQSPYVIFFFLLLLQACSGLKPEPPDVSLQSLELKGFNLSHARLQAVLELSNPNSFALNIRHADYRLFLAGVEVSRGHSTATLKIGAGQIGLLPLDFSAAYLDLARLLRRSLPGQPLVYRLEGTVEVGGFGLLSYQIPLLEEGSIDPGDWQP